MACLVDYLLSRKLQYEQSYAKNVAIRKRYLENCLAILSRFFKKKQFERGSLQMI